VLIVEPKPDLPKRRSTMPRNLKTLSQLQAEINRLEQENTRLRLLFRVILDTAYLAVNGKEEENKKEKETNHE
jgi:cell shape-determining protein MreC